MITVADLISRLAEFPSDARVVTPGFDEFGFHDIAAPSQIRLKLDVRPRGIHGGAHDEAREGEEGVLCVLFNFADD